MASPRKILNAFGNLKFSVKPDASDKALTPAQLASLVDYLEERKTFDNLLDFVMFLDANGIKIPELRLRSGNTELCINSGVLTVPPKLELPWYKRPIGSFFRKGK